MESQPKERRFTERQIEIISEIQRVAKTLNVERLSQREFDKHHQLASVTTAGYQFGSWTEAVTAAGLKPYPTGGSHQSPKFEDAELLQIIIRVHKALGKQPSEREYACYARENGLPSLAPYVDRWRTFGKARELAYKTFGVPET